MNKPHKWAKEIKHWADGGEIEARTKIDNLTFTDWMPRPNPQWETGNNVEYRIKPQPKEPQYLYAYYGNDCSNGYHAFWDERHSNHIDMRARGYKYIGKIKLEMNDE